MGGSIIIDCRSSHRTLPILDQNARYTKKRFSEIIDYFIIICCTIPFPLCGKSFGMGVWVKRYPLFLAFHLNQYETDSCFIYNAHMRRGVRWFKGNILTHGSHNILDNMEYTKRRDKKLITRKWLKILSLLPNSNIDILNSGRQWKIAGRPNGWVYKILLPPYGRGHKI